MACCYCHACCRYHEWLIGIRLGAVELIALAPSQHRAWGECYKTCFVRDVWIFIISQSVCPWKAFPA
jgi:hypothetical protein